MKATQQLKDEHEEIKTMLLILERICQKIRWDKGLNYEHIDMVVDFIKGFADKNHHGKEEKILFPAMQEHGIPKEGGPIDVMLQEHDMGRDYIRTLVNAISSVKDDFNEFAITIILSAKKFIELLRSHIEKENDILFMMADKILDEKEQTRIFNEFKKLETEQTGTKELKKFHEIVETLKFIYMN